jgi:uncharacterized protein (DUF488 family)
VTPAPLWTIGHGKRAAAELVALLQAQGVQVLVDVRRFPASRRNPQFNRAALENELGTQGIGYEWAGEVLGGRRDPAAGVSRHPAWRDPAFRAYADHMDGDAFRGAFSDLLGDAAQRRSAIMCAETLWWQCHRRLLSDAAVLRGTPVVHLMAPGPGEGHRLHPAARAGDDGWPVYDVGVAVPLLAPESGERGTVVPDRALSEETP